MVQQLQNLTPQSPLEALLSGFTSGYVPARQQRNQFEQQKALQEQQNEYADRRFDVTSQQQGAQFDKNYELSQQELAMKKQLAAEDKIERARVLQQKKIDLESDFINRLTSNSQSTQEAQSLIDMSQQYKSAGTPEQRMALTLNTYDSKIKNLNQLTSKISEKKRIGGLSEKERNVITKQVGKLNSGGISESDVATRLASSGLSEYDIEQIMTPESASIAIKNIRKVSTGNKEASAYTRLKTPTNIKNNNTLIGKAIKDGGSINLLYTKLKESGYSDMDAQKAIQDASENITLTKRQEEQLFSMQEQRRATLSKIMGR